MHFHIQSIDKSRKCLSLLDGLTCQSSDQWFRKLEFLYSILIEKLEAVNMYRVMQYPRVYQTQGKFIVPVAIIVC